MLRNERFNKFAKSLRPDDWESRIKVILPLIEKHAKQIWPNCSVGLHGSVLREVHNEYGSDIDIAIHTNSSCSEREFLDLCHWLTIEEDFVPLSDSSEVGKAAKFLSHGLKVDVAIQERFGDASLYDSKFIEQLRQLYKSHLQEAARVAKFAFPELKGLDVEFLVCCLAERRLKLGQTVVQSSDFFLEICLELRNFPLMPSTSPLQHLLKNVRAQRGPAAQKDLREGLLKTQHFADVLLTELNKPSKSPGDDVKHVSRTHVSILAAIVIFGYMAQQKRLHKLGSHIARRARERPSTDIQSESAWESPFFADPSLSRRFRIVRVVCIFSGSLLTQEKNVTVPDGHLKLSIAKFAFPDLKRLDMCLVEEAERLTTEFPLVPSTLPLKQLHGHVLAQHGPAGKEVFRETLGETLDRSFHVHRFVNSGLKPPMPSTHFHQLSRKMQGLAKMDRKIRAQGNRSKVRLRRKNRTAKVIGKKKRVS